MFYVLKCVGGLLKFIRIITDYSVSHTTHLQPLFKCDNDYMDDVLLIKVRSHILICTLNKPTTGATDGAVRTSHRYRNAEE